MNGSSKNNNGNINGELDKQARIRDERHKEFGQYLQAVRKQISFGTRHQMSRSKLGELTGLGEERIKRIERGGVVDLFPCLAPIAKALDLREGDLPGFYERAGYIAPVEPPTYDKKLIVETVTQFDSPTCARTPLWDIIAFNEHHRDLWSYTDEQIRVMADGSILGANLLRVIFDLQRPPDGVITERLLRAAKSFRKSAAAYLHTSRYEEILGAMLLNALFRRTWNMVRETWVSEDSLKSTRPYVKVSHPKVGDLDFFSMRLAPSYIGHGVEFVVYTPSVRIREKYHRETLGLRPRAYVF